MESPKYAKFENERRWLIAPETQLEIDGLPCRRIDDWYIDLSRLRLRRESVGNGPPSVWKLCKKYGRPEHNSQPIVNVYLDETEYALLRGLPGKGLTKRRYTLLTADLIVIDVFEGQLSGLRTCEVETESPEAIAAFTPPPWVGAEVTDDVRFSGAVLANSTFADLPPL